MQEVPHRRQIPIPHPKLVTEHLQADLQTQPIKPETHHTPYQPPETTCTAQPLKKQHGEDNPAPTAQTGEVEAEFLQDRTQLQWRGGLAARDRVGNVRARAGAKRRVIYLYGSIFGAIILILNTVTDMSLVHQPSMPDEPEFQLLTKESFTRTCESEAQTDFQLL